MGYGGGMTNRNSIFTVLLILSLTLFLSLNVASAASNNESVENSSLNQTNISLEEPIIKTQDPITYIDTDQIISAASRVKTFIETNNRLPNYVTILDYKVTMPQYLQLVTEDLSQIKTNSQSSVGLLSVNSPLNTQEDALKGSIAQSEYLELAENISSSIEHCNTAPGYVNSSLGNIQFESLVYMYSKIMNYFNTYKKLPNTESVTPWSTFNLSLNSIAVEDDLTAYLLPTKNCQSDNPTIISLAQSITADLTSTYDKANAIFNWVRDNTTYSYYYNTKKGAVKTLNSLSGNCVDQTHLLIALSRAAGIPARYRHGTCTFSDGKFGHVWAQLYVNGIWYVADTISNKNTLGVINNWNTKTYKLKGTYAELPF